MIMEWDHVILNGTLVTGSETYKANLYIRDGKIYAVTDGRLEGTAAEVTDAEGLYVFPGFIDSHVHSRDGKIGHYEKEDFFHSTMAGACGGITTLVEMPNTYPPVYNTETMDSLIETVTPKAHIDFGVWGMCMGKLNNAEITKMAENGLTAFKYFWGYALDLNSYALIYNYKQGMENVLPPLDDGEVFTIFREVAKTGRPLGIHAENFWLVKQLTEEVMAAGQKDYNAVLKSRPAISEVTTIQTAIAFAKACGTRLHILHLAAGDGVEVIRRAKRDGVQITCETCPHYLFLSDEDFERTGALLKTYPVVRTKYDQELLWGGLQDGTIDFIATDHAPHLAEEKQRDYWDALAGISAIETNTALMFTAVNEGKATLNQAAAWLSENSAKTFGWYPRKGSLRIGTDADIAIVDMNAEYTFDQNTMHSRTKLSPYHGRKMKGRVVKTILRGMTVAENGEIVGTPRGRWIPS